MSAKSEAIRDFIVDEGDSGIWHYVKYASGFAECYGGPSEPVTLPNRNHAGGSSTNYFYELGSPYDSPIYPLPFPFEKITSSACSAGFFAHSAVLGYCYIDIEGVKFIGAMRGNGSSNDMWANPVRFSVTGTWK